MHPAAWAYYSAGAGDEVTLRRERDAFEKLLLVPRVLRGVDHADTSASVLGAPIRAPIMVAPTGVQGLAHPEGECATARGAGEAGTLMAVSTVSSRRLEDVAAAATGPLWFQLYVYEGARPFAETLVRRAERAGYGAIVLTVDAPRWGRKERFLRVEDELPPGASAVSIEEELGEEAREPAALTPEDVAWLRSSTGLPIVLKGILHPEDAALAVEHGVEGVVVSTHGGRQLDGVPASVEALPAVVEAVAGRAEVYMDGGIRRGTDVLKALALGARAVFVGRPVLWGLAADGAAGVGRVLEMLREELELAMILAGLPDLESVGPDLARKG
ncbi:alpha-hydroxy-acid oxidizing protein [Rubrobacter marinus]|uniref:Alpha-hydroxy-acid oxidizing protein n=2 Tax=Rubrobacter marinus TaxID=2653852 RepID=A0A6G8Q2C9_9ACTN|nr:alpha-hydroxy-acid oxidizing protein [Rubrobacter marinus]